jgi:vacuolar-type H+-ATPase subunit H
MATRGLAGSMQRHPGGAVPAPPSEPTAAVDAAIATVLAAEQAARSSIAAAEAEAESIVATARSAARRIAARAALRAAYLHDALQQRLDVALAAIESRRRALHAAVPEPNDQHVAAAARRLARHLTVRADA